MLIGFDVAVMSLPSFQFVKTLLVIYLCHDKLFLFYFLSKAEISNQFLLVYNFIYALLSIAVWGKQNA
jgi:hypothetical protein